MSSKSEYFTDIIVESRKVPKGEVTAKLFEFHVIHRAELRKGVRIVDISKTTTPTFNACRSADSCSKLHRNPQN